MRILVSDDGPAGARLARRLADAGHAVVADAGGARPGAIVAAISRPDGVERVRGLRRAHPGVPVLALTRVPFPDIAMAEDLKISLAFPGFGGGDACPGARRPRYPLALPGTVVGPLAGAPRPEDTRFVEMLRAAGIRASARAEMQLWLTVAAAWLSPLRGAVVAAAQQGLALAAKEDLITVAARAVRERLHLARTAGLPLDAGTVPMLLMPESWTAGRVREIARALLVAPDLPSLPTSGEAVKVRERLEPLARSAGVRTPAADFLDGFAAEDVQAHAPSAAREPVEAGESRRSARR